MPKTDLNLESSKPKCNPLMVGVEMTNAALAPYLYPSASKRKNNNWTHMHQTA